MPLYTVSILLSCSKNTESSFAYPSPQHQDTSIDTNEPEEDIVQETVMECIDGFTPVPTENPIYCIMECEAQVTQTGIHSQLGAYPSSNVSYYDAQEYCASMNMRLPTLKEWIDAGDGVIGDGGTNYPWGDDLHAGECVLPYENILWETYQSCGYLSTCMSTFGVYDQIGNLWEWADAQLYVDIDAWMLHQEEQGYFFSVIDDVLHTSENTLHGIHPFVIGLSQSTIDIVDGMIWIRTMEPFRDDLPGVGYLKSNDLGNPSSHDFLPISLVWDEQRQNAQIRLESSRDGEPIPAKVGGSFYSGADSRLDTVFWGHVPVFDGSIGFRCMYNIETQ